MWEELEVVTLRNPSHTDTAGLQKNADVRVLKLPANVDEFDLRHAFQSMERFDTIQQEALQALSARNKELEADNVLLRGELGKVTDNYRADLLRERELHTVRETELRERVKSLEAQLDKIVHKSLDRALVAH
jgi:predicted RNase H-like nuclease (RuvC/YqgF family)